MDIRRLCLPVLLALVLAGCGPESEVSRLVRSIETPAARGSGQPNLALGADGKLYLSWIEPAGAGHALRFATWRGDRWSEPRTIATGDDWFVNWADFPSLAASSDGTLLAHWLTRRGAGGYSYDVRLALSRDGGRSWSESFSPHDDLTETEHGFVSIVPRPDGGFDVVWLDGREMAIDGLGHSTGAGAMTLRSTVVGVDGGMTAASLIDGRVCDCCSTDAVRAGGALVVAFRDRSEAEIRDIATVRAEADGWSASRLVRRDDWKISGCPVNGPALAARDDSLACAWFTAADQTPRVHVAFSPDGGSSFGEAVSVDGGRPTGRVDLVLLDDGSAVVSWLERGSLYLRWVAAAGPRSEPLFAARTGDARAVGFPRLALLENEIFLAWTEPGEPPRVRTGLLPARY